MNTLFGFEIAVGIFSVNLEGNGLDARLIAIQIIQHIHCKTMFVRPSGIHTVQHARPVAGLCSACSRMERHDRIILIVFSR